MVLNKSYNKLLLIKPQVKLFKTNNCLIILIIRFSDMLDILFKPKILAPIMIENRTNIVNY